MLECSRLVKTLVGENRDFSESIRQNYAVRILARRSLKEFTITDTELSDMAKLASMGLMTTPKIG